MKEISSITGGRFYRAKDVAALNLIYEEISKLEKTKIEVFRYYRYTELFVKFLFGGLLLLMAEFVLSRTILGGIPE